MSYGSPGWGVKSFFQTGWESFWNALWIAACTAVFWGSVTAGLTMVFYLGWSNGAAQILVLGYSGVTFWNVLAAAVSLLSALTLVGWPFWAPIVSLRSRVEYGDRNWRVKIHSRKGE